MRTLQREQWHEVLNNDGGAFSCHTSVIYNLCIHHTEERGATAARVVYIQDLARPAFAMYIVYRTGSHSTLMLSLTFTSCKSSTPVLA